MRDDVDAETRAGHLVDGERGPVERDRALGRDIHGQMLRRLEREAPALAVGADVDEASEAVDMAGNDMAAELVAGTERALQVDPLAGRPGAERRFRHGFVRHIDREAGAGAVGRDRRGGQADAIAGDRGPDRDPRGDISGADGEAATVAGDDLADVGDDAGEHGMPHLRRNRK